jgi:hypothetical protein
VLLINFTFSCMFFQGFTDDSVLNNIVIFTLFGIMWGLVAQVYHVQTETGNKESIWDSIKNYQILDNISHAIIQTSSFWIMYLIARYFISF